MNKDIHGYYVVNNQKFHSKVQALICASELLNKFDDTTGYDGFCEYSKYYEIGNI